MNGFTDVSGITSNTTEVFLERFITRVKHKSQQSPEVAIAH